ncbi:tetratricopeptide repeat-containing sensor histidine kinase [Paraflavitalea pollutisoli]|uniref:tetratricopeptide repeat-containing sensor histidine kinase n=1 Tax=Paraflavitalea pollutisoli TaxID=3034143 RepID=UPI0023ED371F|nr:sensor histidine kinase [Paraflavitalea sp. H1-2-19X]
MYHRLLTGCLLLICAISSAQSSKLDSLLKKLPTAKEDSAKVMLLRDIGALYVHQDPQLAVNYFKQGAALAKRVNFIKGLARCYINIATGYSFNGQLDSSIIYSDTAIYYSQLTGDPSRLALVYLNRADNYLNLHDSRKALVYCDTALVYAEKANDKDRLGRIYHIIGDVYSRQRQYDQCTKNYHRALQYYQADSNYMMEGQIYSDFGDMFRLQEQYDSALVYHQHALKLGKSTEDHKNLATYHAEVGSIYILQKKFREARPYFEKALEWGQQQGNNLQMTVAYARMAELYNEDKNYAAALAAGQQSYHYATLENEYTFKRDAAVALADAYAGLGEHQKAFEQSKIALQLGDSLYKQQYDAETATLEKNFEVAQKDKEIALLHKDKQLQQQEIRSQRLYLGGSVILVALAVGGIFLLISRHRLRQRMKELELRNRIAADLHDEVGSSLSSIHMLSQVAALQNGQDAGQTAILEKVSTNARETMDRMGDIVWMIKPGEDEATSLIQRMERFMYEICGAQNMTCTLDGTEVLHKLKLTMQQRKNFYLVFKEAINNAAKYSAASGIHATITLHDKQLGLQVRDDGKGFDTAAAGSGNGLDNMRNRARELKGELAINSQSGHGTEVHLLIPV